MLSIFMMEAGLYLSLNSTSMNGISGMCEPVNYYSQNFLNPYLNKSLNAPIP